MGGFFGKALDRLNGNSEISFRVFDVGGQDKLRDLWKHYYPGSSGIIFMVDSNDRNRIDLANKELHHILNDDELNDDAILLVLANKQDLPNAMSVTEITQKLSLTKIKKREWHILPTCATSGDGLFEGLDWISNTFNRLKIKNRNGHQILIIGLDAAGKTTFLYKLKLGETVTTIPTIGFNCETVSYSMPKSSSRHKSNKNTIGLSMGGAKNVGNFRKCIEQNIMPSIDSITYEGLLYEYQFDTSTVGNLNVVDDEKKDDGSMLFYPTYCYAKTKKIDFFAENSSKISTHNEFEEDEYFMTVGLNSNIEKDDFKRKHLNLIIVLDKSGSMGEAFNGDNVNFAYNYNHTATKMYVANKAIIALLKHLTDEDRFGLITFDQKSNVIQNLECIQHINMDTLQKKILNIQQGGGTNFESGYNKAIQMYKDNAFQFYFKDKKYENRIMLLTDAQPNIGNTDPDCLLNLVSRNALNKEKRIYTTIIGVGLNFNDKLINKITKTRGCNYFTVDSTKEFIKKMDEEFEFMVSPLVFNVLLKLKCEGNACKIDNVYGVNDKDYSENIMQNGEITKIDTLFAAKRADESGEIQGGILLIKLKKIHNKSNINVTIEVSFEDRNEKKFRNEQNVTFKNHKIIAKEEKVEDMIEYDKNEDIEDLSGNYYDNNGIRKGILLCKYIDILKEWIEFEEKRKESNESNELRVNKKYKFMFVNFNNFFKVEMKICKDATLQKEIDILNKLINTGNDNDNDNDNETGNFWSSYFSNLFNGKK